MSITQIPIPGGCPHCSTLAQTVIHSGPCPHVKAVEYHPNGTIKRIEYPE